MSFNVGDIVRVRSDLVSGREYGADSFTDLMISFLGKDVTITEVHPSGKYHIEGSICYWTKQMFVGLVSSIQASTRPLQVGDSVTIKRLQEGVMFGDFYYTHYMRLIAGKVAIVDSVLGDTCRLRIDNELDSNTWTIEMLDINNFYKGVKPMENAKLLSEGKQQCIACDGLEYESDMRQDNQGDYYCSSCANSRLRECENCHDLYDCENEGTATYDDMCYCDDCQVEYTWVCQDCDTTYSTDTESISYRDGCLCSNCYGDNYSTCEDCNEIYRTDNGSYCEHCERDFCEDCGSEHDCSDGDYSDDDSRPTQRYSPRDASGTYRGSKKGKYLVVDRLIGVEIEAEKGRAGDASQAVPQECGMGRDGSLDSTGVEVQTPPASMDKAEDIIRRSCKGLSDNGFEPTASCGLHVHIDAHDITKTKLIQIYKTMYSMEDVLYSMLPESRWNNHYCMPFRARYAYEDLHKKMTSDEVEEAWYSEPSKERRQVLKEHKYDSTRYAGLNLHSYYYKHTVEFRQHSGTLNPDKILKWSAILLTIIDYAVNRFDGQTIDKLVHEAMSRKKIDRATKIIGLTRPLKTYMMARIMEHNPDYLEIIGKPRKQEQNMKCFVFHLLEKCRSVDEIRTVYKEHRDIVINLTENRGLPTQPLGIRDVISRELDRESQERDRRMYERDMEQMRRMNEENARMLREAGIRGGTSGTNGTSEVSERNPEQRVNGTNRWTFEDFIDVAPVMTRPTEQEQQEQEQSQAEIMREIGSILRTGDETTLV